MGLEGQQRPVIFHEQGVWLCSCPLSANVPEMFGYMQNMFVERFRRNTFFCVFPNSVFDIFNLFEESQNIENNTENVRTMFGQCPDNVRKLLRPAIALTNKQVQNINKVEQIIKTPK